MRTMIRFATQADAFKMTRYIKKILGETPYMISEAGEYHPSIEDEEYWIKQTYQDGGMILLAFSGRSLIGMLSVNRHKRNRRNHVCSFGISVKNSFQGHGIGKELMRRMIEWCKGEQGLEKITLEVFSNNHKAIQLYKTLGFKEEGRMRSEIRYADGVYADMITMALFLHYDEIT
ncbi:GNAT family N-acetyltransferase [Metabacillus sp. KIGAM252]|uniref:GNAT family N-acetyltransferase n=1 Tax=Metabacillus flavus TaxID=2823519 RepID=A0ABS5LI98_9BACI|nr:GNAT family N-acetyltransferase [Metabacillus flavus]MBS2970298.1 GNAT family N-acetyltransferase [Metabacillus flavus]